MYIGDTMYASSEILAKRESGSRGDVGIVTARTTGVNQRGETIISYERTFMVYKRGRDPRDALAPDVAMDREKLRADVRALCERLGGAAYWRELDARARVPRSVRAARSRRRGTSRR